MDNIASDNSSPHRIEESRRRLLLAGASWSVLALALVVVALGRPGTSSAAGPSFAVLAGITSVTNVTSMSCYGACNGTNPHSSSYPNPVDIGAGTSTPIAWAQVDYLPSNVNGGYVLAYRDTAGTCGEKNNPYNGRRITVEFYYYVNGVYTNYNTESYLHIDGVAPTLAYRANAPWRRWNNPYASSPLWAWNVVEFNLNDLQSGGLYLGTAHNVTQTDSACTSGNHLHQESDGNGTYAPGLALGNPTYNRFTDLHYVTLAGISGSAP